MISFEVYKIVHILCLILLVGSLGAQFFAESTSKYVKIVSGVASLFIMITGMGLIARIGITHGAPWPLWIKVKLAMWIIISAAGPILAKRLVKNRQYGYMAMITLFLITVIVAVTKLA